jgi:hypothetical protein
MIALARCFATVSIVSAAVLAGAASAQTPAASPSQAASPLVRVSDPPSRRLRLFSQPHFRGQRVTLWRSTPNLFHFGLNGRARSLQASGRWQLCTQTGYHGRCVTVRSNRAALASVMRDVQSARLLRS